MNDVLAARVALVSGASRGIGRAVALELASAGARVIGCARPSAALAALGEELARAPNPGFVVPCDVRDEQDVNRLLADVDARTGRLDALVNNAGIARIEPFLETSTSEWRDVLTTNLDAIFFLTQAAARRMVGQGSGDLVFVASDAAIRGIARMAAYCASKHAVLGLARTLHAELKGSGVRVTTIMPGPVNTTILRNEADRADLPQPEDIAATVRYALSLPARVEVQELLITPASGRG